MKSFRQLCAALVLTMMLALPALAGDIAGPGIASRGDIATPGITSRGDIGSPGIRGEMQTPGITGEIQTPGVRSGIVAFLYSLFGIS
jgi:hypothetical protein